MLDGWGFQCRDNASRGRHNCRKANQSEVIIFHLGKYLEIQKLRPFGMLQENELPLQQTCAYTVFGTACC